MSSSLCSTLLFLGIFMFVSGEGKNITAGSGQNVTLTCRAPNNNIIGVKWSSTDLEPEYVLFYRNGQFDLENQHPSFKNRVDLQDRQMKDGDVSLILKDVTINDTGRYECRVFSKGRNTDPISIIYLKVFPPGQTGGHTEDGSVGLIVGLSVSAVLLVVVVAAVVGGVLIYRKHKRQQQSQDSYKPPVEQQDV